MAGIDIPTMMEIQCEVAPSTLFDDLAEQERRVTAKTPGSGITIGIPSTIVTMAEATKLGRVMAAYFGTVPRGRLANVVGLHAAVPAQDLAAKTFRAVIYKIQSEKFGRDSFIQKFVRGKASTSNFHTQQNNLAIDARICEFPVANETQTDIDLRATNRQAYLAAMAASEQLWINTYTVAFDEAKDAHGKAKGAKKVRLARTRELYRVMKDAPPRCNVNLATLLSKAQAEKERMIPLSLRAFDDRFEFWFENAQRKDVIASHFEASILAGVDIRRMATDAAPVSGEAPIPPFYTIVANLFGHACELLHEHIMGPLELKRNELLRNDRSLTTVSYDMPVSRYSDCYYSIDRLRYDFGLNDVTTEYGGWTDIPVLVPETRGEKHSAPQEDGRDVGQMDKRSCVAAV